jgi:hypothetical protein
MPAIALAVPAGTRIPHDDHILESHIREAYGYPQVPAKGDSEYRKRITSSPQESATSPVGRPMADRAALAPSPRIGAFTPWRACRTEGAGAPWSPAGTGRTAAYRDLAGLGRRLREPSLVLTIEPTSRCFVAIARSNGHRAIGIRSPSHVTIEELRIAP